MHRTNIIALLFMIALICTHAPSPRAAPKSDQWIRGSQLKQHKGPVRQMLAKGRSIYIGYNGYFDDQLRWHNLPREFSDATLMKKPGVLAIYRGGRSLAHRINIGLAAKLRRRYAPTLLGHMFTHTGGRMFFGPMGVPHIKIAGVALVYPTKELDLGLLLKVLRSHFSQQPRHKWPHTKRMLDKARTLDASVDKKAFEKTKDKTAFFFYIFHAVYSAVTRDKELLQSPGFNRTKAAFMTYASTPARRLTSQRVSPKYAFSMVYFWRNDLDWYCRKHLQRGLALGFRKVAFFYPVHYSVFRRSGQGSSYKLMTLAGIPQGELNRCLRRILQAGLDLHFIPHLEDTKTIIANWEVEWRINGGVALGSRYYKRAFGPLLEFLRTHKELVKRWQQKASLRVTVAAEVDRMVFAKPRAFGATAKKLKAALRKQMGRHVPLVWNPNGDLAAVVGDATRKKLSAKRCGQLTKALQSFDSIAPTIYDRYGHLGRVAPGKGLFVATRDKFLRWLDRATQLTCPNIGERKALQAQWSRLTSKDFSFGELALDPHSHHSYAKLHRDFVQHGGSEMILWTTNQWDPVGITRKLIPNRRHFKEITNILRASPKTR